MIPLLASVALAAPLAEGPYHLEMETATDAKVPFLGMRRVVTRTVAAARLTEEDGALVLTYRPCAITSEGGGPGKVTFPAAFVSSFAPSRAQVVLTRSGEGWQFAADPGPVCLGCEGALPGSAEEAGDWEGDGEPGATISLRVPVFGKVDLYIAQRSHASFVGEVRDGGVVGNMQVHVLEQRTLGASNRMFAGQAQITPVSEASGFRLIPVAEPGCEPPT